MSWPRRKHFGRKRKCGLVIRYLCGGNRARGLHRAHHVGRTAGGGKSGAEERTDWSMVSARYNALWVHWDGSRQYLFALMRVDNIASLRVWAKLSTTPATLE